MKTASRIASLFTTAALVACSAAATANASPNDRQKPLVQVALLLDTSNSMDGLIEQAKSQLWKICNEFIKARQDGVAPEVWVALYEYGNTGRDFLPPPSRRKPEFIPMAVVTGFFQRV